MPKVYDCVQGESDWLKVRLGKVTASEAHNILTPKLAIKKGDGVETYAYKKAEEACRGGVPLPGFSSWATEQGEVLEMEARTWCAVQFEIEGDPSTKIHNVGFIEHDDGRCGCSPDALIGDDGGLEIKCPQMGSGNHARYVCEKILPDDYAPQVHMALYVTGRPWWRFVSYSRRMPKFVLTVERNEKICATIAEALAGFYEKFDAAMKELRPTT